MKFSKPINLILTTVAIVALTACMGGRKDSKNADGGDGATFRVETIAINKVATQKYDALGLPKQKLYNFSACIQDEVLRAPIILTQFAVSDGTREIPVRSDNNGCLLWSETHEVNYLQPEALFEVTRTIVGKDIYAGSVKVRFAFNPWNDGEALLDLRKQTPAVDPQKITSFAFDSNVTSVQTFERNHAPAAYVSNISMDFLDLDFANYRVNEALTLTVAHKFRIHFSPVIVRRNLARRPVLVPLNDGAFKLRLFLLRSSAGDAPTRQDVISSMENTLSVRTDGSATGIASLSISDISLVASKMKVLVELTPVSLSVDNITPGYYIGQINPLKSNGASIDLEPASAPTIAAITALVTPALKTPSLDPLSLFIKKSGMISSDLTSFDSAYNFHQHAMNYIEGGMSSADATQFMMALCLKTFQYELLKAQGTPFSFAKWLLGMETQATTLNACVQNPHKYLDVITRDFVSKVNNPVPRPIGTTREYSMTIANNFEFSSAEGTSKGAETSLRFGLSAEAGVNLSAKALPSFASTGVGAKIGIGQDWFVSKTKTRTASSTSSATVSYSQTVSAIANTFEVDVNFKRCLLFGAKAEYQAAMSPSPRMTGFYSCSPKVFARKNQETYYFVNQSVGSSPFTDPDSSMSTKWRMTLRGNNQFSFLKSMLANPDVVLEFQKIFTTALEIPNPTDFNVTQSFPGMLSQ